MDNLFVRRCDNNDADTISKIICRNFLEVNIKDYPKEEMEHLAKIYNADKVLAISEYAHMYVVCLNETIVGCGSISSFWGKKDESILLTIFVLPEFHGKGIGKVIIEALEKDEYFLRAKRIEIPASITACEFYKKLGYNHKNGIKELDDEGHYRLEKYNIKEDRISLRIFNKDEYHKFWQSYIADPVCDPNGYVYDKEKVDKQYDAITKKQSWYLSFGVFLDDSIPMGTLSLKRIDHEKSQCELGIMLTNDNYKGLGYGSQAVKLAIDYAFNTLNLKYIYADTMGSNLKMQRILDKFGFKLISKDEHFYDMKDRWEDKLNYVLINS